MPRLIGAGTAEAGPAAGRIVRAGTHGPIAIDGVQLGAMAIAGREQHIRVVAVPSVEHIGAVVAVRVFDVTVGTIDLQPIEASGEVMKLTTPAMASEP